MSGIPLDKQVFSLLALLLTFVAFVPYMRAILRRQTRPHVFSWLIWAAGTVVVFFAQLADGAGIGAWPIGISGAITFMVAFLAMRRSADTTVVRSDWVYLALAATALPLWWVTADPLYAVVILTTVDLLGFGPSMRKAYGAPYEENATFFSISALRNGFVVLALEAYTWTTVLFPAAVGIACVLFVALILARRRLVSTPV